MQIRARMSSTDAGLTFESQRALPGGSVEIVCAVSTRPSGSSARDADWAPASQRANPT
jgi:hypothetical protein